MSIAERSPTLRTDVAIAMNIELLVILVSQRDVTLLYAARDREYNHAVVLMQILESANSRIFA